MLKTVTATSLAILASSFVGPLGAWSSGRAAMPSIAEASVTTKAVASERVRIPGVETKPQWDDETAAFLAETGLDKLDVAAVRDRLVNAKDRGLKHRGQPLPAIVVPKKPIHRIDLELDADGNPMGTGRITLKFRDGLGVRASLAGTTPAVSVQGADVSDFNQILEAEGAAVKQLIHMTENELEGLRRKAFERSNRIQPDLAAMLVVEFAGEQPDWDQVLRTAQALNAIEDIEWVSVEPQMVLHQEQECGTNMTVPCNRPTPAAVSGPGSATCWDGDVTVPAPYPGAACNPDPQCQADPAQCVVGCMDAACCNAIAAINAYCDNTDGDRGWDVYCAALANATCDGTIYDLYNPNLGDPDRYDPCLSNYYPALADGGDLNFTNDPALATRLPLWANVSGLILYSCYEEHPQPACSKPACCASICVIDPFCCVEEWDAGCVSMANDPDLEACVPELEEGVTPDSIAGSQAYLTASAWPSALLADPNDPATWFSYTGGTLAETGPYLGFSGQGLDLPGLRRTIGVIWRLYGSGSANPVLPNPDLVWMDGEEFQVIPANGAPADAIAVDGNAPRSMMNPFPEFAVDPGFNYDNIRLLPTGRVQQVAVCEFSAYTMHEEFTRVLRDPTDPSQGYVDLPESEYRAIPEPGQTQNFLNIQYSNHGLACLGVTVGPDNGFGIIGVAPRAQGYFYPIESVEEGNRTATALAKMAVELDEGAVCSHSWGPVGPYGSEEEGGEGRSITWVPELYTLVRVSTDAGLIVCNSAGNNCAPMVAEAGPVPSGVIVVGAAYPGFDFGFQSTGALCFDRRASFSNYSGELTVPVYAWGVAGTTTGTGNVFRGLEQRSGLNFIEAQYTRSYQGPNPTDAGAGFNGTSFACPQIAGGMAVMQGVARMFWDQTFNGDLMLVAMPGVNYSLETGATVGTPENCQAFGYGECFPFPRPCYGDTQPVGDPDCPGIQTGIGVRMRLPAMAAATLTTIADTTNDSLVIYTGTRILGGAISITNPVADGAFLQIRSELASQGPAPDGLVYFGTGQTIDFGLTLDTSLTPETYEDAQLETRSRASAGAVIVEVPLVRNRVTNRWIALGVQVLTGDWADHVYDMNTFGNSLDYFNAADQVDVRVYTLALGFSSTGRVKVDWDYVAVVQADPNEPL